MVLEHPDFYLVSKPPMWLTHRTRGRYDVPSVLEYMRHELGEPLLAPPHRLDRETSGVVLVAKDPTTARCWRRRWESHDVEKLYLAIVHGHVRPEGGLIDAPLGKDEQSVVAIKDRVRPDGAASQTEFRVLRRFARAEGDLFEAQTVRVTVAVPPFMMPAH